MAGKQEVDDVLEDPEEVFEAESGIIIDFEAAADAAAAAIQLAVDQANADAAAALVELGAGASARGPAVTRTRSALWNPEGLAPPGFGEETPFDAAECDDDVVAYNQLVGGTEQEYCDYDSAGEQLTEYDSDGVAVGCESDADYAGWSGEDTMPYGSADSD